jgi:putative RNA 2'-phosphotransferase
MRNSLVKKSRFLSLVLRHKPETIGLTLDENGWIAIDTLLDAAKAYNRALTREELDEIVATNNKKRFAISQDGRRIRASQGHSLDVDLALQPRTPPPVLYHGTAVRFLPSIRKKGLQKMNRQHVHLSSTEETAKDVGSRHGKPAILLVKADAMHTDGYSFFLSDNGVWLTDTVPAAYLEGLDE